ncbi:MULTISPECIES: hypothetical protein [Chryseobacterium]|uniref:Uncharacterized protein n=1 Tax=Chryseobacterium caseinilyticum TaxID=2771428 RepID=A0ABR8Z830_9FLAO|nr:MULTISPECIES: hypothetical protein [Chryseobacterium]KQS92550.1 hypothetical protein ASG21_08960 [Chryseobacterium sp. Leaf394]MBD8081458.1 hypothetical protein [Chryseobacterium caseinilyticum]
MNDFNYTVIVPPMLHLMLGYETQIFKNENLLVARQEALHYLSKIVNDALEKNVIQIFDFENANSTDLKQITTLEESFYHKDNQILNFKKLSECKITYHFNDYIRKDAVINQTNERKADETLNFYGFLSIRLSYHGDIDIPHMKRSYSIFEFRNANYFISLSAERRLLKTFNPANQIVYAELEDLVSEKHFNKLEKTHEAKEVFYRDDNAFEKEIITTEKYFEFERIYLSLVNSKGLKYVFFPFKNKKTTCKYLRFFEKMYPSKKPLTFFTRVEIEDKIYMVFEQINNDRESIIHAKTGKVYFRSNLGVTEASEDTLLCEILDYEYINPELRILLDIL